jgi:glycosyltransferase involved in cell wall biosynthesis
VKVWIALHCARNICVSHFVQRRVGCDGTVIPNPYDHRVFLDLGRQRTKDLVFVGRLVSDKGVRVLIDALCELKRRQLIPTLKIIGDGPERPEIERQIRDCGLVDQVAFAGWKDQDQIAESLNEHKILVVPSLWQEPFGIVALEGAASGCVVVGSSGGGLPEAIGPCGITFPNGDSQRLADILAELLQDDTRLEHYRRSVPVHLQTHSARHVAQRYMEYFCDVVGRSWSPQL